MEFCTAGAFHIGAADRIIALAGIGDWYLVTRRMPWARYDYALKPGWPLERYGIEQQAEIVKHAFWLRNGVKVAGIADPAAYDLLVRFPGAER